MGTSAKHVLLVDPDPAAGVVATVLRRVCAVTTCPNASEALVHLAALAPDLVVCPCVLPDLDVTAFVRAVHAKCPSGILVVATSSDAATVRELSAHGIDGVFEQPIRLDRFLKHVYALLAQAVDVSPSHLAHIFKVDVGVAPIAFLNQARMEVTRRMLVETDATLREIADAVGFADAPSLSRAFRRHVGDRPGRYRRWQQRPGR